MKPHRNDDGSQNQGRAAKFQLSVDMVEVLNSIRKEEREDTSFMVTLKNKAFFENLNKIQRLPENETIDLYEVKRIIPKKTESRIYSPDEVTAMLFAA